MANFALQQTLRSAVGEGVAPCIVVGAARGDGAARFWCAGDTADVTVPTTASAACAATADTLFDLASLTKPLTTTLWALRLVERGLLDLDHPIGSHVEVGEPLAECPVWRLMNHTSGLPAHRRYYEGLGPFVLRSGTHAAARQAIHRMVRQTAPTAPFGRASEVYSDLGYLLLEQICESVDRPLSEAWSDLPGHGPDALRFMSPRDDTPANHIAPTEVCPWRARTLRGEVHDDNCWTMGGVAGHAGLFGSARDVLALGRTVLATWLDGGEGLGVSGRLFQHAVSHRWIHRHGTRVLGWDTPTPGASSAGQRFARNAIGHLGFTGTSIWLDPGTRTVITVLTNRVHPSRDDVRIRALRPTVHDLTWSALDGASA
jgi:CubicO group peptidase (beta-lactamase class C family)